MKKKHFLSGIAQNPKTPKPREISQFYKLINLSYFMVIPGVSQVPSRSSVGLSFLRLNRCSSAGSTLGSSVRTVPHRAAMLSGSSAFRFALLRREGSVAQCFAQCWSACRIVCRSSSRQGRRSAFMIQRPSAVSRSGKD